MTFRKCMIYTLWQGVYELNGQMSFATVFFYNTSFFTVVTYLDTAVYHKMLWIRDTGREKNQLIWLVWSQLRRKFCNDGIVQFKILNERTSLKILTRTETYHTTLSSCYLQIWAKIEIVLLFWVQKNTNLLYCPTTVFKRDNKKNKWIMQSLDQCACSRDVGLTERIATALGSRHEVQQQQTYVIG